MRKTKEFTFQKIFLHPPKTSLIGGIVLGIAIIERILERWGD
ncbi:hypothetical protein [Priestia megaterium]|nr:hypothetical protein [Priestia megaterium]